MSPVDTERTATYSRTTAMRPVDTERTATYSRTTETRTTSLPPVHITAPTVEEPTMIQRLIQCCCSPVQSLRQCCCSMSQCCGLARSDYPAIVVFATISVIMLSFVLEKHVE